MKHILNPRFLSETASYDVASNLCLAHALPRQQTHPESSFLESNVIKRHPMTWRVISGTPWVTAGDVSKFARLALDNADWGRACQIPTQRGF
jgi:hypothetical protein